jgi:hypothetical protein
MIYRMVTAMAVLCATKALPDHCGQASSQLKSGRIWILAATRTESSGRYSLL